MTDGQSPMRPQNQRSWKTLTPPDTLTAAVTGVAALLFFALPLLNLWLVLVAAAGFAALILIRYQALPAMTFSGAGVVAMFIGALLSPDLSAHLDALLLASALLIAAAVLRRWPAHDAAPGLTLQSRALPMNETALVTHIQFTVDGMIKSALAVNEVAAQQSSGATEQIELIELTTHQVDEFIEISKVAFERIRTLTKSAQEATETSLIGQMALDKALASMAQIRARVDQIGATTLQLAQLTQRIDRIITSVSEIATQSNLLALNASIEAARAGVHGRGFAVVADEVRALAQQSTQAAQQVRAILSEVQSAVKDTVAATEVGIKQTDEGTTITRSTVSVMSQLDTTVNAAYEAVKDIANMLRTQSDGLEEIAINMERVNRITQKNIVSVRLIEQVSRSLSQMADELQGVMDVEAPISEADAITRN